MIGRINTSSAPSFWGKNPSISPIWAIWLVKRPYVNKKKCPTAFYLVTSHIQLRRLNPFCFYKLGTIAPPLGAQTLLTPIDWCRRRVCPTIIIRTLNTRAQVYYSAPIYTFHLFLEPQQKDGCFKDWEMEDRGKKIKLFTHLRLRPRSNQNLH